MTDIFYDMSVLIPTRGRPFNMLRSMKAMLETDTKAVVWYVVSRDDPEMENYIHLLTTFQAEASNFYMCLVNPAARGCMPPTNAALWETEYRILGNKAVAWMGDDHLPRTKNWDQIYFSELEKLGTGVVYGNDLGQGANLATQVCMSSSIVKTLGYFCPPTINHLYCDNVWMSWGGGIDRIKYLPDVVVEHMHPGFGKAVVDTGYSYSGSSDVDKHDRDAYKEYLATQYTNDIAKLMELL